MAFGGGDGVTYPRLPVGRAKVEQFDLCQKKKRAPLLERKNTSKAHVLVSSLQSKPPSNAVQATDQNKNFSPLNQSRQLTAPTKPTRSTYR